MNNKQTESFSSLEKLMKSKYQQFYAKQEKHSKIALSLTLIIFFFSNIPVEIFYIFYLVLLLFISQYSIHRCILE